MRAHLKTLLWIAVAAVAGYMLYRSRPWQKSADDQAAKFETAKVDRGPIVAKVTASGTLSAIVTVQVGSQVSGRIKDILVNFNSVVKKGQIVARLDPQILVASLAQARANYNAALADLQKSKVQAKDAQRQLARQRSLNERKLTAQADYDTSEANAEVADAQVLSSQGRVEQTQAALNQAQVNLNYATIESPIDGVVISRSVDVGQTVSASLQTPTLFVIAEDLRKMQVDTSVAEADVGKLQADMDAVFSVDAYPTERFEGKVRQIRNAAQTVQNVVTYDAVIDVNNPELKLRPGMTANVTFVHEQRQDALRIANAALRFKPTPELLNPGKKPGAGSATALTSTQPRNKREEIAGRRTLWVLQAGKPVAVQVKTGITDGSHTEIVEGALHEGDQVIVDVAGSGSGGGASPGGRPPSAPGGFRRIL